MQGRGESQAERLARLRPFAPVLRRRGGARVPLPALALALALAGAAFATTPDAITMHHGAKAAIPVLANDAGSWNVASVSVVTAPTAGTAVALSDGRIRYAHTTGTPAVDVFTYRATNLAGVASSVETVTVSFSSQARLAATTLAIPPQPPTTDYQVIDAFPGLTFSAPVSMESPPGDTNLLFVLERRGTIQIVTNISVPNPLATMFLDFSSAVTNDNGELGAKGLALHPGYTTNGIFFVAYNHASNTVRLSRFSRDGANPNIANPTSEVVLIDLQNDGRIHNINDPVFGPDGYLYLGFGDEGSSGDSETNTQVITKDLWSSIVRLDPDKRPGNLEPHAHACIPTDAGVARFSVPADNPFVGATQFNGVAVNPAQVRTEFYAIGFRNPWQFNFDPLTGELWVGDVGHQSWESVSVMPPGGNGGWAYFEGTHPGPRWPPPAGFTNVPPVWEYPHDPPGPFTGSAVIGGLVVRGTNYPDLYGKYLCADVIFGHIWSVQRVPGTVVVERIASESTIVQFGIDQANGTILMVDYDEGRIRRLVISTNASPYPQKLSETGVFADLADLAPNPGVVPYDVNLAFWSDYAAKRRWFALTNLVDTVGYARDEPWATPTGAVWIKHFDMDLDRGNPGTRKRLETRLLVRTTNGSYGVSYRWNDAGTEAALVPDAGDSFDLAVTNAGAPAVQHWRIPSRSECAFCHTAPAGHALSFSTRQLNRPGQLADAYGNFLDLLSAAGYLAPPAGDPQLLPRFLRPDEASYSLEARARSYLAVNCGYCHRGAASTVQGSWDGRAHVMLSECGLVLRPAADNGGDTNNLLVVPGQVPHSIVWNRIAVSNGFTRMPPLATSEKDPAGIQLVADWIAQELPGWQSYDAWRQAHFGSTNSPDGERGADPDGDARENYEEFLTRTSPTNAGSAWSGAVGLTNGAVEVSYDLFNRSVLVESSPDLVDWAPWSVAGNNGISLASGVAVRLSAPSTNEKTFYRFRIEER